MSVGRVIGTLVVIIVLYAIITQPATAAQTTRGAAGTLGDAGSSVIVFLQSLTGGTTSSSYTQVNGVPYGGVATGDGSYR
jgi:hypothetical protein